MKPRRALSTMGSLGCLEAALLLVPPVKWILRTLGIEPWVQECYGLSDRSDPLSRCMVAAAAIE